MYDIFSISSSSSSSSSERYTKHTKTVGKRYKRCADNPPTIDESSKANSIFQIERREKIFLQKEMKFIHIDR